MGEFISFLISIYKEFVSSFFYKTGYLVVSGSPPLSVIMVAQAILDASRLDLPKGSSHLEQATNMLVYLRIFSTYEFSLKLMTLRFLCLNTCFSLGSSPITIDFQFGYSLRIFRIAPPNMS